jgi:hypothetical protein
MKRRKKIRKDMQILIRVSAEELEMVKKFSNEKKVTVSKFLRDLINNFNPKQKLDIHKIIIKKYEETLEKFRKLYSEYKKY